MDWATKNAWDQILRFMCQPIQIFELMSNDTANTNFIEKVTYSTTMNTAREITLCHYYCHLGMDIIWFPGSRKIRHLGFILKTEILFFRLSFTQITLALVQHLQHYHCIDSDIENTSFWDNFCIIFKVYYLFNASWLHLRPWFCLKDLFYLHQLPLQRTQLDLLQFAQKPLAFFVCRISAYPLFWGS